jgi:hypothetical protein
MKPVVMAGLSVEAPDLPFMEEDGPVQLESNAILIDSLAPVDSVYFYREGCGSGTQLCGGARYCSAILLYFGIKPGTETDLRSCGISQPTGSFPVVEG